MSADTIVPPLAAADDDDFLQQFETRTLPFAQWTHRAHLKVAYLYLTRHPYDEAVAKMRNGIRLYNAAHNVQESATSGYHETTTLAWLRILRAMLREYGPAASADAFLDAQPQVTEKKLLRLFYSRERFTSAAAKSEFVEPDLTALPEK